MSRPLRPLAISALTLGAAVGLIVACNQGDKSISCTVDVDCPQGFVCRTNVCVSLLVGDASIDAEVTMACLNPGDSCNTDDQCCTPPCRNLRCSSGTGTSGKTSSGTSGTTSSSSSSSGTTSSSTTSSSSSSGGSCTDLYGICAVDSECCAGLSCMMGTCR